MNPERLPELLRQRELVRAHLAWLDREIAAASGASLASDVPASAATPISTPVAGVGATATSAGLPPAPVFATELAADPSAPHYEPDPGSAALDVRRGCLTAFVIALLLLGALLSAVYLLRYRDRPLLFAPREPAMTEKAEPAPKPAPPQK